MIGRRWKARGGGENGRKERKRERLAYPIPAYRKGVDVVHRYSYI